jgi:hypothetical protein
MLLDGLVVFTADNGNLACFRIEIFFECVSFPCDLPKTLSIYLAISRMECLPHQVGVGVL